MINRIAIGLLISLPVCADTIEHYMNIASNIPKMEMKADPQSQAWARSARNVLLISSDSIAETFMLANDNAAKNNGSPLFCLPAGEKLSGPLLDSLIQETYKELATQQNNINQMTVSQIAYIGMNKKYACNNTSVARAMQALPTRPNNPNAMIVQNIAQEFVRAK